MCRNLIVGDATYETIGELRSLGVPLVSAWDNDRIDPDESCLCNIDLDATLKPLGMSTVDSEDYCDWVAVPLTKTA